MADATRPSRRFVLFTSSVPNAEGASQVGFLVLPIFGKKEKKLEKSKSHNPKD
jgi:hypothetical protein